ncbi:unnamed protein product [Parascedosporium putredinis]|uniref:HCNGP-like protein n=1 Tax=Parascedosporium putredinis TaxID=1442378 RepID=A0A9P1H5K7_9PEZI|nr:unnamed protein product [Parascedosporium putredinis]CAI7997924.1 unnamed protein product [Parascedosporium putredinis]
MAGLVSYGSSSEDEDVQPRSPPQPEKSNGTATEVEVAGAPKPEAEPTGPSLPLESSAAPPDAFIGPVLAPSGPTAGDLPEPDQEPDILTMPPDLPTPPPAPYSVENFLELKDKGVHFNAKLQSSAALRNPALLDKLLAFAELDEAGPPVARSTPRRFPRNYGISRCSPSGRTGRSFGWRKRG